MERHGDHRADGAQIHFDAAIVIRHRRRGQFAIVLRAAMNLIKFADRFIRLPDGGKTRSLRRHHVDADAEVGA